MLQKFIWEVATRITERIENSDDGYQRYRQEYQKFKDIEELRQYIVSIKSGAKRAQNVDLCGVQHYGRSPKDFDVLGWHRSAPNKMVKLIDLVESILDKQKNEKIEAFKNGRDVDKFAS